jgi:hypothetical protein
VHEDSYSELKLIKAGVPQGNVLGPVLYLLYINDMPTTSNSTMATFADNTAVMAVGEIVDISTRKLQSAVNKVAIWTRKWRIKLNESKSVHTDLTNKIQQQPIFINGTKAILSCQFTINSHYTSKLYVQFGVMVSSSGAVLVNPIFK